MNINKEKEKELMKVEISTGNMPNLL